MSAIRNRLYQRVIAVAACAVTSYECAVCVIEPDLAVADADIPDCIITDAEAVICIIVRRLADRVVVVVALY